MGRAASTTQTQRSDTRSLPGGALVLQLNFPQRLTTHGASLRICQFGSDLGPMNPRGIVSQNGRLDVVIHNAGHMVFGPAEAFTPEQLAELYDVNVLSTQRVNRAALPVLRQEGKGLVVWVGSSSTRGGTPPYLAPYFAAKAGMDALAVSYAGELARWDIETTIVVPGAFTSGTNHFAHAGSPEDKARLKEYESGPTVNLTKQIMKGFELTAAPDADVLDVAKAIVKIVDMPFGTRPFRVHIDPAQDRSRDRKWCCRPCPCGTASEHAARGSTQAVVN
jgi:hypothetical protein